MNEWMILPSGLAINLSNVTYIYDETSYITLGASGKDKIIVDRKPDMDYLRAWLSKRQLIQKK